MATLTIEHPEYTDMMTLATTVSRIEIPAAVAQGIQAIYLYCASEIRYQRAATALADGATAPTDNYDIIPAATRVPLGLLPSRTSKVITVWVTSGTPTLHVAPYPVTAA